MALGGLPVSVVVISKNSGQTIGECLESVARNRPSEVIVVDGGSTDSTIEIAARYTERIIHDGGRGKSHARNLGAEAARSDYVAYVDSDVVIPENALSTMLGELVGSGASAVSSIVRHRETKNLSYWSWAEGRHLLRWYRAQRRAGKLGSSYLGIQCCIVRRDVLLKYRFETRFSGGMDDVDLQYRLLRDGHRLAVSTVVSEHIKNQSLREFFAYRVYMGRVRNGYFLKHRFSYLKYFPLTMEAYWVLVSLAQGAFRLIPYHLVNGVAQTLGFIEGT
jgi:glycosyltransferase involved in cell wall biosynthesis